MHSWTVSKPAQHTLRKDFQGMFLLVAIAVPALYTAHLLIHTCPPSNPPTPSSNAHLDWTGTWHALTDSSQSWAQRVCSASLLNPLVASNVVFVVGLDLTFWVSDLVLSSTWLIDPYWTIIPVLQAHFYQYHPTAPTATPARGYLALVVLYVWSVRLTFNYFRREDWHFGVREDWRYADFRQQFGSGWWWRSLFYGFVVQHVLLFAASMPLHAAMTSDAPLCVGDFVAAAVCLAAVVIQGTADKQLHDFVLANEERARQGRRKVLVLDSGLWYYSRHPNHFGEAAMWWGMAGFALSAGFPAWYVAGACLMTSLFWFKSIDMVEARMRRNKKRIKRFDEYCRTTSSFIPWFKFRGSP